MHRQRPCTRERSQQFEEIHRQIIPGLDFSPQPLSRLKAISPHTVTAGVTHENSLRELQHSTKQGEFQPVNPLGSSRHVIVELQTQLKDPSILPPAWGRSPTAGCPCLQVRQPQLVHDTAHKSAHTAQLRTHATTFRGATEHP